MKGIRSITLSSVKRLVVFAGAALLIFGGFFVSSSAAADVHQAAAPTAAITSTQCYAPTNGVKVITWFGAPVTPSQPVVVSISEGVLNAEGMGDARMSVENVTVLNSAVQVRVNIQWPTPLFFCLHFVG